jgi:hypothetical protein
MIDLSAVVEVFWFDDPRRESEINKNSGGVRAGLSIPILPMAAVRRRRHRHRQHPGRQLIVIEIDVASSDTIQRGMHHGLSRRISAVAYKERLRNT